ncbi:AraC family transcriptional regulator [Brenneria populi subsp. brevivirga]|uniref:AraC family transcriptional regulator n=1 Tax=Brenneria populi TaxID=1505588 RepID=UPI002E1887AA|nr:AraC family transcriptional regulator [Brenneria populi subsp. brevivirga]
MMKRSGRQVQKIRYQPEGVYPYDLEVFKVSELRLRSSREGMRRTYGYTFYMLILVTEGHCIQLLDFEPCPGEPGSLFIVRPGQAHNFGENEDWDGWVLLARPEFLWPASSHDNFRSFDIGSLPACLHVDARDLHRATTTIMWMMEDAARPDQTRQGNPQQDPDRSTDFIEEMTTHLRYEFYALISWLAVTYGHRYQEEPHKGPALQRFHRFRDLVEQHFVEWKSISTYAAEMGCTERSLTRAVLDVEGIGAKDFVLRRLSLEAKRLLIHTDWPIGVIADKLGFREATHFSKFFRRINGCTPQNFRTINGQG